MEEGLGIEGVGDDVGTLLLITAMAVAAAASEVIDGRDIALLSPPFDVHNLQKENKARQGNETRALSRAPYSTRATRIAGISDDYRNRVYCWTRHNA